MKSVDMSVEKLNSFLKFLKGKTATNLNGSFSGDALLFSSVQKKKNQFFIYIPETHGRYLQGKKNNWHEKFRRWASIYLFTGKKEESCRTSLKQHIAAGSLN